MDLLIITPTLGNSPWLKETINSVEKLRLTSRHVLVAPDPKIGELRVRYPACKVIADTGRGMYEAINTGIASVDNWDAFTYINDDDILLDGFRAAYLEMADVLDTPAIIYGGVQLINTEGQRIGRVPVAPKGNLNRALYEQGIESVYQQGTLTNRIALEKIGLYDTSLRYCGDTEWFARAALLDTPFIKSNGNDVAAFRIRPGQLSKDNSSLARERALIDHKLKLRVARLQWRHTYARFVFRASNLSVYLDRLLKYGWVTNREVNNRG